jgi:futalosine hydrolase
MNLLIVAATEFEVGPFIQHKNQADVLITGVGAPATIYHLTKKLITNNYHLAIQAGIAGTFADDFTLGNVVAVKEDTFADLGIEENGEMKTLFKMGFYEKNQFPFTNEWLVNSNPVLEELNLPWVKAVTVNKVSDNPFHNRLTRENFGADVESMEGAAFHYVCLQQKINFLQLRGISNQVGERDKSKWKMKDAIENLNNELLKIVDNL